MPDQYYDSKLTGEQLDAAFLQVQNIQQTASQVQSNATAAAQSASQASQSASSASRSASQASTSAQSASESQSAAASSASSASESAKDAAASASSIEGDVEQAAASANAASQSATQAASSASAAAASATAAADSEDEVQANAAAAQQAAASASASEGNAKASETAAASSAQTATGAASAAQTSETNAAESARQAAASVASIGDDVATSAANAQAAQQAASDASASAAAAEDAATRAEQIADFDPSDFATAAQGTKADTAVQSVNGAKPDSSGNVQLDLTTGTVRSVNGKDPDGSGNVQLSAGDVGAATAAQGQKADSAVQTVNGQEPDTQGNVQITIPTAGVTSVNGKTGAVTLSASDVDAAQEPLTGDITNVTPAQVREALQAGRQVILTVNSSNDILAAWVDTGTYVQCLYGWDIGAYANRPRAFSTDAYSGNPTGSNTWSYEKLYGNVLPEVTSADNGKTVVVQNGQWNLGTAGGGGKFDFVANTGLTSWSEGSQYSSAALYAGGYDAVGIVCLCNGATASDEYSPIQWFPIPARGQSRKYGLFCMDVNNSPMGEAQVRMISITNNGSAIQIHSDTPGYYYNWGNKGQDNTCAVPAFLYGMKF